jgi:hypothetical protein
LQHGQQVIHILSVGLLEPQVDAASALVHYFLNSLGLRQDTVFGESGGVNAIPG